LIQDDLAWVALIWIGYSSATASNRRRWCRY
jgi:hypothetical protein